MVQFELDHFKFLNKGFELNKSSTVPIKAPSSYFLPNIDTSENSILSNVPSFFFNAPSKYPV